MGRIPCRVYPGYAYETIGIALHVLSQFIIPTLIGCTLTQPDPDCSLHEPRSGASHRQTWH
ncbi:MAG UNVERIFIED_CONTAM: hypothetical protein LVT10_12490 [Anaerolineae bacterium]